MEFILMCQQFSRTMVRNSSINWQTLKMCWLVTAYAAVARRASLTPERKSLQARLLAKWRSKKFEIEHPCCREVWVVE